VITSLTRLTLRLDRVRPMLSTFQASASAAHPAHRRSIGHVNNPGGLDCQGLRAVV